MQKKGKKTFRQTKNKKSISKGTSEDKPDETCPVCGDRLYRASSGTWCLNQYCVVLDDADNYR